ncbi:anti-sigma factor antagonist [Planomonospora algeriensis]
MQSPMNAPSGPVRGRPFAVSLVQHGGVMVVHLTGDLDAMTVPTLRASVQPLWEQDDLDAVVLDTADMAFCDSTGISALIGALKQCQAAGKRFLLSGVHGTLARFLTITGLRRAFEICDAAEQAVQAASSGAEDA